MIYRKYLRVQKSFWTILIVVFLLLSGCSKPPQIQNPYESVNWQTYNQYKANLHTHTTRSDGSYSPQWVVDSYKNLGYSILSITDHNAATYPWTDFESLKPSDFSFERLEEGQLEGSELIYENRDPNYLGMIAIQGCEISSPQHLGSYFTDLEQRSDSIEITLNSIKEKNGILMFNHPGKYDHNVLWYTSYFQSYPQIVGIEVFNQGNRYPNDKQLWDSLLVNLMPERPVWGFSNDDFHSSGLGRNWNIMLLPELTQDWVREGMTNGLFFFVYAPLGHNGMEPPKIDSIIVDRSNAVIEITASGYDSIHWISHGRIIEKGNIVQLKKSFNGSYIRAEVFGKDGAILGTQPFGVLTK
ncbi:MAG: hypothetical protein JW833_13405 [Prolixibacteraceae bacterium]|nr:hypothetical protein [Prolixibacteraceae bacterium]